jgi:hypothetical protein
MDSLDSNSQHWREVLIPGTGTVRTVPLRELFLQKSHVSPKLGLYRRKISSSSARFILKHAAYFLCVFFYSSVPGSILVMLS